MFAQSKELTQSKEIKSDRLFKSYKPELVPERIPSMNIESVWKPIPEALRLGFEDARNRGSVHENRRHGYFDWNLAKVRLLIFYARTNANIAFSISVIGLEKKFCAALALGAILSHRIIYLQGQRFQIHLRSRQVTHVDDFPKSYKLFSQCEHSHI